MRFDAGTHPSSSVQSVTTRIIIPAKELAVRDGLSNLLERLPLKALSQDDRGTIEIVLAEALNNIVEHAYARFEGEIEISLSLAGHELKCLITDWGLPMPDQTVPAGELLPLGAFEDLPEGGFGWHLIRTLSKDLSYRRIGDQNLLSFKLDTKQSQH